MVSCPCKVGGSGIGTGRCSGPVLLTLGLKPVGPFLHQLLVLELDGKVLDPGVALPPDLNAVRPFIWLLVIFDTKMDQDRTYQV